VYGRRRPWKAPGIRERAPRNPPAYWALNGRMVVLGTGESLLGPVAVGGGKRCAPITGEPGKWRAVERQSERVVVLLIGVQHNAPGGKGPRFIDAREGREGLCECRSKG
jgi:hypothetical protein